MEHHEISRSALEWGLENYRDCIRTPMGKEIQKREQDRLNGKRFVNLSSPIEGLNNRDFHSFSTSLHSKEFSCYSDEPIFPSLGRDELQSRSYFEKQTSFKKNRSLKGIRSTRSRRRSSRHFCNVIRCRLSRKSS